MLLLECNILHDVISPSRIRETNWVRTILELLDDGLREAGGESIFSHIGINAAESAIGYSHIGSLQIVIVGHLVVEVGILVRTCLLYHLCWRKCCP